MYNLVLYIIVHLEIQVFIQASILTAYCRGRKIHRHLKE